MKKLALALITAMVLTTPVLAQEPKSTEEFLARLNKEMMELYILQHNTDLNAEIMLDDYVFVASMGKIETREDVLATVGNLDIHSASITHNEFRQHGPAAVLVGTLQMDGSISNRTVNATMRFMSVFVYLDENWRLMARSFSPVVEPSVQYGSPETN